MLLRPPGVAPAKEEWHESINTPPWRNDLIELLVVIGIIAVCDRLALAGRPEGPRRRGPAAQSLNNLKQMALACHNFHDANETLPPAQGARWPGRGVIGPVHFHILDFIEQGPVPPERPRARAGTPGGTSTARSGR